MGVGFFFVIFVEEYSVFFFIEVHEIPPSGKRDTEVPRGLAETTTTRNKQKFPCLSLGGISSIRPNSAGGRELTKRPERSYFMGGDMNGH